MAQHRHLRGERAEHRPPVRAGVGASSRARSLHVFESDRMWDVAKAAMPQAPIADSAWLDPTTPTTTARPAPSRCRCCASATPIPANLALLDPQQGVIASRLEHASRWNRWLYHGFHSLDFPFLYYKRPLWDLIVILLSLGGVAISVTSALPAWRRLVRQGRQRLAAVGHIRRLNNRTRYTEGLPITVSDTSGPGGDTEDVVTISIRPVRSLRLYSRRSSAGWRRSRLTRSSSSRS